MLTLLRSLIFRFRLRRVKKYFSTGNSHLFEDFQLIVYKPQKDRKYLEIGDDNILNCKVIFESGEGKVLIGDRNYIGDSSIICRSRITFEDNIFVAWGCYFYDHDSHSTDYVERENDITQQLMDHANGQLFIENKNWNVVNSKPIKICSNAWVGMNCIILKGVTIGEGAIVGAGSVLTKDVAPWTIVGGNPATLIKEIPIEYRKKK